MKVLESAFSVLSCIAGIAALLLAARDYRRSQETHNWMPVHAKVLGSKVVGTEHGPVPEVWYRYTLDGHEYDSSSVRLSYLTWSFGHKRAASVTRQYPATAQVIAYVNPHRHSEAVLQQGSQPGVAAFVGLTGLFFLALGFYQILSGVGGLPQ